MTGHLHRNRHAALQPQREKKITRTLVQETMETSALDNGDVTQVFIGSQLIGYLPGIALAEVLLHALAAIDNSCQVRLLLLAAEENDFQGLAGLALGAIEKPHTRSKCTRHLPGTRYERGKIRHSFSCSRREVPWASSCLFVQILCRIILLRRVFYLA